MVEPVVVASVLLLALAVLGSVVPLVPAGVSALAGVYLYQFAGPGDLGLPALAAFTLAGLALVVLEHVGGALGSRAGGASIRTTLLAAVASVALFFVLGPAGAILGLVAVVVAAELAAGKDRDEAVRTAAWTLGGLLASAVVQVAVTLSMLVAFCWLVFG